MCFVNHFLVLTLLLCASGTRVYFFTQDELDEILKKSGLVQLQNHADRRLLVNRGKQLTMHRVWIQCKYRKCDAAAADAHASSRMADGL